jgi:hypothetical protein
MPEENSGDADRSAVAASHARLSGLRLIADAGGIADRKIESRPAVQMKVAATQAKSRPAFKRQKRGPGPIIASKSPGMIFFIFPLAPAPAR